MCMEHVCCICRRHLSPAIQLITTITTQPGTVWRTEYTSRLLSSSSAWSVRARRRGTRSTTSPLATGCGGVGRGGGKHCCKVAQSLPTAACSMPVRGRACLNCACMEACRSCTLACYWFPEDILRGKRILVGEGRRLPYPLYCKLAPLCVSRLKAWARQQTTHKTSHENADKQHTVLHSSHLQGDQPTLPTLITIQPNLGILQTDALHVCMHVPAHDAT